MYDDFWAGYNSGNGLTAVEQEVRPRTTVRTAVEQSIGARDQLKGVGVLGTYDKSKVIKMRGPNGEDAEIYANGKMYIIFPGGKSQARTFPSRPWGIRYMQKRGWVLV